jgi:hypothetical protein
MRASDAERESVVARLRQASAEGRLLTDELEERLEAAFSARTYGQLNAVLADLPGRRLTPRARRQATGLLAPTLAILAVPLVVAAIAAVVFVLTGVLAVWMLWLAAGWWFFGPHRRRLSRVRHARGLHGCGSWQRDRDRARGSWV